MNERVILRTPLSRTDGQLGVVGDLILLDCEHE